MNNITLCDTDWEQLRELILDEARDHDTNTAFQSTNINVHESLKFILHIYQCGREKRLPPEWSCAYKTMHIRKGEAWKEYQRALNNVEEFGKAMEQHELVNLSNVVGASITSVLQGDLGKKRKRPKK